MLPLNIKQNANSIPGFTSETPTARCLQPRGRRQHVRIQLKLSRNAQYYTWNVMLMLCLISTLGFVVYGIPGGEDDVGDRINGVFALLLTSVAYKFFIADMIPKVAAATVLDKYVWVCLAILVPIASSAPSPACHQNEAYLHFRV